MVLLVRLALLSLVIQVLPITVVHINGEDNIMYICKEKHVIDVTVMHASAQLTKGCILEGNNNNNYGITFDIKAMYAAALKKASPKDPVTIEISYATFINYYIKLVNAPDIPNGSTSAPLQFTMSNSVMSGASKMIFGDSKQLFKLPPHSRLQITHSELTISSTNGNSHIFTFYSLQLMTDSSIEIAYNVITMEYIGGDNIMVIFYLPKGNDMKVMDMSSFTLQYNKITMNGITSISMYQYVWYQQMSSTLTISKNSLYSWVSNIINIVGYNVNDKLEQFIWFEYSSSMLTITETSNYTCAFNYISMMGHDVDNRLEQYVWYQGGASPLTVSGNSIYTWVSNIISLLGYNIKNQVIQSVWDSGDGSSLTITEMSTYSWRYNNISIVGYNINDELYQQACTHYGKSLVIISKTSIYVWVFNIISMVGYAISNLKQYIWQQDSSSSPSIDNNGNYTWLTNSISLEGHKVSMGILQHVWFTSSIITITNISNFLFDSNKIIVIVRDYDSATIFDSYIMVISTITITKNSSMVWRGNCVAMGQMNIDKRNVFLGKWSTDEGSELLLDGNYFTTTDEDEVSGSGLANFVMGPKGETEIAINGNILIIKNTEGATTSKVWERSLFVYNTSTKPTIDWSPSRTIDNEGVYRPIFLFDVCGIPNTPYIPPVHSVTTTPTPKSAIVILPTTPVVLVILIVLFYLYN